jgi:hypothetical protein
MFSPLDRPGVEPEMQKREEHKLDVERTANATELRSTGG